MSCEQMPMLRRLMVDRPDALETDAWQVHVRGCEDCRGERHELARSLAVYRQLEGQMRNEAGSGPSWEAFSVTLARERRWQRICSRMRTPIAAASVFVAVGVGAVLWPAGAGKDPSGEIVAQQTRQSADLSAPAARAAGSKALRELAQLADAAARVSGDTAQPVVDVGDAGVGEGPERVVNGRLRNRMNPHEEPVRAPVLLFRSLRQQEEVRRAPIRAMPVSGPAMDLGTHAFVGPQPIR